jgi:hypothetical protein
MGAGLAAALFVQGMSTPLFYEPSTGAAAGLALFLALSASRNTLGPAPASGGSRGLDPDHDPQPENDPAREWDMRPL